MAKKYKSDVARFVRFWFFVYDPCFDRGKLAGHGSTVADAKRFLKDNPGSWVRDLKTHTNLTLNDF